MIQKFKAGEKLRSVTHLNQVVDGLNELTQDSPEETPTAAQSGVTCFGINQSAVDLPYGACVAFKPALDAMPFPDDPTKIIQGTTLLLDEPSEAGDEWCITAQRIPAGSGGLVYVSGTILARVRDEASTDEVATIDPASDWWHLKRGADGAGKLLWAGSTSESTEDDTSGYRWALVRFPFGGGGAFALAQATADGTGGTVTLKAIQHLANLSASPNFEQTGDEFTAKYFKT